MAPFDWKTNKGHYLMVLEVKEEQGLQVGRLGRFILDPGTYCYVGRARRNLKQRIARHSRSEKSPRWHIDHLLPHANLTAVFLFPERGTDECRIAKRLVGMGGRPHPPRFGASDCRCRGHLIHFDLPCNRWIAKVGLALPGLP